MVRHYLKKAYKPVEWKTPAGTFLTSTVRTVKFKLSSFSDHWSITWDFYICKEDQNIGYDLIIGRDLLLELGMILDFKNKLLNWDGIVIDMPSADQEAPRFKLLTSLENYHRKLELANLEDEPQAVQAVTRRALKVMDVEYKAAVLEEVVATHNHLSNNEKCKLTVMLNNYKTLFDGSLGDFKIKPVSIELKPDAKPVQSRPFTVAQIYREKFKTELDRLVSIGVLTPNAYSEWSSPSFLIPKRDGQIRFLSDFRKVNTMIKRKPYPMPLILDLMQTLEGFTYATTLDLNMVYYTIKLDNAAKQICTIVTPWGKYSYKRLPMGLSCAPDIFQHEMSNLMQEFDWVRTYLDDLLVLSSKSFEDHLNKV